MTPRPRIALVTFDPAGTSVHADAELEDVADELRAAGLTVETPIWSNPRDWSADDLVILKSPWDYSLRPAEFRDWLEVTSRTTTVLNHPALIAWNSDKHYLRDLAAAGIPTTDFTTPTGIEEAAAHLAALPGEHVIIKPTVSAGSLNTGLFARGDRAALDLIARILDLGKTPMVMPAIPSVAERGELAMLFFGGRFSHAVRKGPILAEGGGYLGGEYTEVLTPDEPARDEVEVADACLRAVAARAERLELPAAAATPLYARVDMARGDDGPVVLELEMFEPAYFTWVRPEGRENFVRAVLGALDSLDAPGAPGAHRALGPRAQTD